MYQAIQLGIQKSQRKADAPIGEILKQFLTNRASIRNNRGRTVDEYRCQLLKFAADFGHRPVVEITAGEIEEWLSSPHFDSKGRKRTWGGSRRNVTRGYIATMFNFGTRKGLCSTNPAAGVDKAIVERAPIETWSPTETAQILAVATRECPELIRFLVLALFSGVRTCELFQLSGEHVKLDQHIITVPAAISKNRKLRNVPITGNLTVWLTQKNFCFPADLIWPMGESSLHRRYRLIEKGTGLKWRKNALRHSYASNHLALHDNEYLTSRACGHTPKMLREHYDAVVSKANAGAYFGIFPPGGSEVLARRFARPAPNLESLTLLASGVQRTGAQKRSDPAQADRRRRRGRASCLPPKEGCGVEKMTLFSGHPARISSRSLSVKPATSPPS
jgi:site-specific recombinase XerD